MGRIDLGVVRFATLSDGMIYAPLNSFRLHEAALRRAQQAMSHKRKFSNNWKKAKARVHRIHSRIGNARCDHLRETEGHIGFSAEDQRRGLEHHFAVLLPNLTAEARRQFEAALDRLSVGVEVGASKQITDQMH